MQLQVLVDYLKTGQNIFLTGGAGVGKTTLTRQLIASYAIQNKKVAKLASTGIAATLIGGQTLHSFFDFSIAKDTEDLRRRGKFALKNKISKLIRSMNLIIIDEISMVSADLLDMVYLRLEQSDFSGSLMVVGDFLQLPPVAREQELSFAFEAQSWKRFAFKSIELTHNFRSEDIEFNSILNSVRLAQVGADEHLYLHNLICPIDENISSHTLLFGTNASAAKHNAAQLKLCDGVLHEYIAHTIKKAKNIEEKMVEQFYKDSRVAKVLSLKVGVPVLFTANAHNYINGERGVVEALLEDKIRVRKSSGIVVTLERTSTQKSRWDQVKIDGKLEFIEEVLFTAYQFPLTLAYAITIHKSQGMSIEHLVIDTTEIFAPSQFYVALSRATNIKTLILKQPRVNWSKLAFVHPKALEFTTTLSDSKLS